MHAVLPYFRGSNDQDEYEREKNHFENFFKNFSLTSTHKCHYTQLKLAGEDYRWWKDNHINSRDWLIL